MSQIYYNEYHDDVCIADELYIVLIEFEYYAE